MYYIADILVSKFGVTPPLCKSQKILDHNRELHFANTWVHSLFFGGLRVAHLFNFLYVIFMFLVYLSPLFLAPSVACVSGLFIIDCTFCFF
jgi:hypothetical protein